MPGPVMLKNSCSAATKYSQPTKLSTKSTAKQLISPHPPHDYLFDAPLPERLERRLGALESLGQDQEESERTLKLAKSLIKDLTEQVRVSELNTRLAQRLAEDSRKQHKEALRAMQEQNQRIHKLEDEHQGRRRYKKQKKHRAGVTIAQKDLTEKLKTSRRDVAGRKFHAVPRKKPRSLPPSAAALRNQGRSLYSNSIC